MSEDICVEFHWGGEEAAIRQRIAIGLAELQKKHLRQRAAARLQEYGLETREIEGIIGLYCAHIDTNARLKPAARNAKA